MLVYVGEGGVVGCAACTRVTVASSEYASIVSAVILIVSIGVARSCGRAGDAAQVRGVRLRLSSVHFEWSFNSFS